MAGEERRGQDGKGGSGQHRGGHGAQQRDPQYCKGCVMEVDFGDYCE